MKVVLLLAVATAHPTFLECARTIAVGEQIMGSNAIVDTTREWIIERDGVQIPCGGEFTPGETLNARLSNHQSPVRYVMELAGGEFASGCDGSNLCSGSRCAKGTSSTPPDGSGHEFAAPTGGTLTLNGAWASAFGAVNVPAKCELTSSTGGIQVPGNQTQAVQVKGFLVDLWCMQRPEFPIAIDGADLLNAPEDHSVHCMRDVQVCRENGFGILVQQPDGTYDVTHAFDTLGNEAVLRWLDATTLIDTVEITVTGFETGSFVTAGNGTWPELGDVLIRYHNEKISHSGYLIDLFCWGLEGHVALDGADLDTNPQAHSVHCMRDVQVCRDGGFGILRMDELSNSSCGAYDLAYTFDDVGTQLALDYVDSRAEIFLISRRLILLVRILKKIWIFYTFFWIFHRI